MDELASIISTLCANSLTLLRNSVGIHPPNLSVSDLRYLKLTRLRVGCAIASEGMGGIILNLKIILPAAIVLGGFLVCSSSSYGKTEYVKQTKKACNYCHV